MDLGLTKGDFLRLIHDILDVNDLNDENHVHIRLAVSRGSKSTPYQNPKVNISLPLSVIIPVVKAVDPSLKTKAHDSRPGCVAVRPMSRTSSGITSPKPQMSKRASPPTSCT